MKRHVAQLYQPPLHCKKILCQLDLNALHNQLTNFHMSFLYQATAVGIELSRWAAIVYGKMFKH